MKYFGYFEKYKFNTETNHMDSEFVRLETNITYKNCKEFRKYFWIALIKYVVAALLVCGLCLFLGLTSSEIRDEKIGIVFGIVFSALIIVFGLANSIFGWSFEFEQSNLVNWFNSHCLDYAILQKENMQEYQEQQRWRDAHPFEEKVRKALESKNGNDVAELIKMILEMETM